jgi:hypothetical protein
MLASSEARFSWGMASLLGAAPFYAAGAQQLLQKLGPVMEQAQVGGGLLQDEARCGQSCETGRACDCVQHGCSGALAWNEVAD